jgi:hypothetical protein
VRLEGLAPVACQPEMTLRAGVKTTLKFAPQKETVVNI